ncbi:hypothetical protein [Atopobium sp. oral taxon 416]|jgi:hypothetical protein|uniref:hypothetical protein n=1 Tax=Atopobium sp. oral taxon 416 TaxID=712157 RepID=UPI001BAADE99|nr:hypothetical protein [Atopobium sp. oral taxon 416]QUC02241.1 hypothetical protein J4859_09270 [Atopobium sp. oral taxon 416]
MKDALQAPQDHKRSRKALSGRGAHAGEHWLLEEIAGRIGIAMQCPDLAVSDTTI